MILHRLDGCAPTPLAHYLKALGVLRLVAEQLDPEARGWWEGERFLLASHREESDLLDFFLHDYSPSALLTPWNAGSGFFRTWDPKKKVLRNSKNGAALSQLLQQKELRWKPLQRAHEQALAAMKAVLQEADVDKLTDKERQGLLIVPTGIGPIFPVANKDDDKRKIQFAMATGCSRELFFRSAIVNMGDEFGYPSLFGTGGNDGAIDFSGRFFENLIATLLGDHATSRALLVSALMQRPAIGLLSGAAGKVGQFFPNAAGGANCTNGPGTQQDTLLNPWDFTLMLEGAILFSAASTRRLAAQTPSRAAAPFAIAAQGAGYASAADSDEGARGEQWMPLWPQPITLSELQRLLTEGRAQLGTRNASEPLDLARAVARLGTARGIHAFQRYGYIERNGQSNLAVPLGRFVVPEQAASTLVCLDDLEAWLPRLRRAARDRNAPARLAQAERRLADALLALTQHPNEASRWQAVLLRLADIEALQVHGAGQKAGPIPRLRPEWAGAADDGSPELRLALAFALQCAEPRNGKRHDGIRRHWLTLNKGRYQAAASDRVMQGRNGMEDAIAVVGRRLIEAGQSGERRLPLQPGFGVAASRHDLARLLAGEVDLDRCLALARALMALDIHRCAQRPPRLQRPAPADWPDDAFLAIRLALLPWPLPDGRHPGTDPAILRRLQSGDLSTALQLALRRLRPSGIRCALRAGSAPADTARLFAAALAFPIDRKTATRFAQRLDPTATTENAA